MPHKGVCTQGMDYPVPTITSWHRYNTSSRADKRIRSIVIISVTNLQINYYEWKGVNRSVDGSRQTARSDTCHIRLPFQASRISMMVHSNWSRSGTVSGGAMLS